MAVRQCFLVEAAEERLRQPDVGRSGCKRFMEALTSAIPDASAVSVSPTYAGPLMAGSSVAGAFWAAVTDRTVSTPFPSEAHRPVAKRRAIATKSPNDE